MLLLLYQAIWNIFVNVLLMISFIMIPVSKRKMWIGDYVNNKV
jgi:hypothetical protein